jgi:predicted S18 family serine protease
MKVRYTGASYNLNNNDIYEVEESNRDEYQIRNDVGRLAWYVKTNFIEVKQKVSANPTNTISPDLVNKIEKELKDTEQRMADLRKQLEDAKLPPTNNILLRETRKNPDWAYGEDFDNAITNFSVALAEAVPSLTFSIHFSITNEGNGIALDCDYKWKIETESDGRQVLMILDK